MRWKFPIFAMLVLSLGCSDFRIDTPSPELGKRWWNDIPIEGKMNYVHGSGHQRPDGRLRTYRMRLVGETDLKDLIRFYQGVLPTHNWSFQGEEQSVEGVAVLRYAKDLEALTLTISSRTIRERTVDIHITYRN